MRAVVAGVRQGLRGVLPRRHQVLRLDRAAHPHPRSRAILFTPRRDPQYCPPGTGEEETPLFKDDAASWIETPMASSAQGERCCLKSHVPPLHKGGGHWTGLAPRAVADGKITKQCTGPPPPPPAPPVNPGCKTWDGKCVQPYPGEEWQHPKIHQSPDCLHLGGWHDMAGALTFDGTNGLEHHAFQGCPASQGWSHSASKDLVHWEDRGRHVHMIHETYEGMGERSTASPATPSADLRFCASLRVVISLSISFSLSPLIVRKPCCRQTRPPAARAPASSPSTTRAPPAPASASAAAPRARPASTRLRMHGTCPWKFAALKT